MERECVSACVCVAVGDIERERDRDLERAREGETKAQCLGFGQSAVGSTNYPTGREERDREGLELGVEGVVFSV